MDGLTAVDAVVEAMAGIDAEEVALVTVVGVFVVPVVEPLLKVAFLTYLIWLQACQGYTCLNHKSVIDSQDLGCLRCINEIGCPALIVSDGQVTVDRNLCTGCGLCGCVCPVKAIGKEGET